VNKADVPSEIRCGVRESLGNGAARFKTFTGGGVTSEYDPLYAVQYTPEEIRYIVEAATQSETYVSAQMAYGTDYVGGWQDQSPRDENQRKEFLILTKYMEPVAALKMATGNAGELAAMTDPNNP